MFIAQLSDIGSKRLERIWLSLRMSWNSLSSAASTSLVNMYIIIGILCCWLNGCEVLQHVNFLLLLCTAINKTDIIALSTATRNWWRHWGYWWCTASTIMCQLSILIDWLLLLIDHSNFISHYRTLDTVWTLQTIVRPQADRNLTLMKRKVREWKLTAQNLTVKSLTSKSNQRKVVLVWMQFVKKWSL